MVQIDKEATMGSSGAIIFLGALILFGFSVWGLFNRRRSLWCAVAGIVVMLGASLGALHAWGESHSIPWTVGYLIAAVTGMGSILRQVFFVR